MILALSIWDNRIAPVFDVACRLRLLTIENSQITATEDVACAEKSLHDRAMQLIECKVQTLICGAISRELESMIVGSGIRVIPFMAGETAAIARTWLSGQLLKSDHYLMPGCCRRPKNRFHSSRFFHSKEQNKKAFGQESKTKGGIHGRADDPTAEQTECVRFCAHCGHRVIRCCDTVGQPRTCPICGYALITVR
jgi:predicted Fe-Mo cluster-binding NifX family protein